MIDKTQFAAEVAGEVAGEVIKEVFDFRPATATNNKQQHERQLQQLIQYSDELKAADKKSKRKQNNTFAATGIIMAAAGVLTMLSTIVPELAVLGAPLGVIGMVVGGLTALSAFGAAPLQKLHDEVKRGRQKISFDLSKRNVQLPQLSAKNRKIIAGVCSTIADKTGIPVGLVRFLYLLLIPFSSGFLIPIYFVAAVALGLSKTDDEKLKL